MYIYSMVIGGDHPYTIAEAYTEPQRLDQFNRVLLFKCPEDWLPKDKANFLAACAYYKVSVPPDIQWFGYVPF